MTYFTCNESKAERQRKPEVQLRNYHSAQKARLFQDALEAAPSPCTLLDLAAGRGADCGKYGLFSHVEAVDRDADAIRELKRRCPFDSVVGVVGDVLSIPEPPRLFSVVSVMFACHYFAGCSGDLDRLCATIHARLQPGGVFVGIDIDGDRVRRELGRDGTVEYADWARMQRIGASEMLVTIRSISESPKREWFFDWQPFHDMCCRHGMELVFTKVLMPAAADIAHPGLRAFSGLHRQWMFRKKGKPEIISKATPNARSAQAPYHSGGSGPGSHLVLQPEQREAQRPSGIHHAPHDGHHLNSQWPAARR